MMNDDEPVGHLFSRREAVALLAATGATLLTRGAFGCVVRPEQTEGPFFFDERLQRSDIRFGRPGKPLILTMLVSRLTAKGCEPLPDAQVDLWQCDAAGEYSDEFLRGYQITGGDGAVRFVTIFPGGYPGRTVHVHFKIRTRTKHELTSQLYFDDRLTDRVHAQRPYASAARRTRNQNDGIYRRGGDQLLLDVSETADGLQATFPVALQF